MFLVFISIISTLFFKFEYFAEPGQVLERRKNGNVVIACSDGFLVLTKVKLGNKIYDKPSLIIKTIFTKLGMDLEDEIIRINQKLEKLLKEIKSIKNRHEN